MDFSGILSTKGKVSSGSITFKTDICTADTSKALTLTKGIRWMRGKYILLDAGTMDSGK